MSLSGEFNPYPKRYSPPKEKKALKKGRKTTGEIVLFRQIYTERRGKCEITGAKLEFHPIHFLHILAKGPYPKFRLRKDNIIMAITEIHHLYDGGSREYLLSMYPKAAIIYDKKDRLKMEYYQKESTT